MQESFNFHDATLLNLSFSWAESELRCVIKPVSITGGIVNVTFSGVGEVTIPATHPWGMSSSVNSWTRDDQGSESVFIIEMQSGDVIRVTAKEMTVGSPSP